MFLIKIYKNSLDPGLIKKQTSKWFQKLHKYKDQEHVTYIYSPLPDISLKKSFETLHKDKVRLHEKKKSYFDVREELIKSGAQLVMRRKQLISELAFIYPIQEVRLVNYLLQFTSLFCILSYLAVQFSLSKSSLFAASYFD